MCNHRLSPIKSFLASGPFKFKCQKCGALLYREHPKAIVPWSVLFFDRMGIFCLVVVFMLFEYMAIVLPAFLAVAIGLYSIDFANEPLKVVSESQRMELKKKDKRIVIGIVVLVLFAVGSSIL